MPQRQSCLLVTFRVRGKEPQEVHNSAMRPAHLSPRNLPGLLSRSSFRFVSKELLFPCLSFLMYKARVLSKISEPLALLVLLNLSLFERPLLCPSHDSQDIHPETRGCPRLALAQNTSAVLYRPQDKSRFISWASMAL